MDLPMIAPAPFIAEHTQLLHNLLENPRQFRHCQPYLTSLMGLPENSLGP